MSSAAATDEFGVCDGVIVEWSSVRVNVGMGAAEAEACPASVLWREWCLESKKLAKGVVSCEVDSGDDVKCVFGT